MALLSQRKAKEGKREKVRTPLYVHFFLLSSSGTRVEALFISNKKVANKAIKKKKKDG